jgi:DNA adenine methylase
MTLAAPFPWFGGKRRVAAEVWQRFGDVVNFVEPFAGSLAVLLGRPGGHKGRIETINDADGFVANFWRAVAFDPEETARWADWPVNESDLHARHAWLVQQRPTLTARLEGDPTFYDARIAGWWVWGVCAWIGRGFCSGNGPWRVVDGLLVLGDAGKGINRQIPHLGNAGMGINRQIPHLGNAGTGIHDWFARLATRLRSVRVACGDWSRVITDSVTVRHGITGVFLDPPYGNEVKQTRVYATDAPDIAADVRRWCAERGDDPRLRIALCGYAGEGHEALEKLGWTALRWSAHGGYGGGLGGTGDANRHRETVWFSPYCLRESVPTLFDDEFAAR